MAGICRRARSTIWKALYRHRLSRWRRPRLRKPFRRYEWAQPVIDDHTRLAYAECHGADTGELAARVLERAIAWIRAQGCGPVEAVMTDNAMVYRHARAFAAALARHHARHIRTPPYTPRWHGNVERFIQTLDREWAKSRTWPNHHARDRALSSFLRYYNRQRPHSSLGDRPPISGAHNLLGRDN